MFKSSFNLTKLGILPSLGIFPSYSLRLCDNCHQNLHINVVNGLAEVKSIIRMVSTKQPPRDPFIKNLFIGNFDRNLLKYPQIGDLERYKILDNILDPIEGFLQKVDTERINKEGFIPAEVSKGLKELGLYGLQIPEKYGGLGLRNMEHARMIEALALDGSLAMTLLGHQIFGVPGLLLAGNEEQKCKYLPKLASGEWTAALCVMEENGEFDHTSIQLTAVPTDDQKGYHLSGTKNLVVNGETADLLSVVARVKSPSETSPADGANLTLFLVERSFGGVKSGPQVEKWGARASDIVEVHFDNTFVPAENVLGQVGNGFKQALSIISKARLALGSFYIGVLKKLLRSALEFLPTPDSANSKPSHSSAVMEVVARASIDLYVMESMTYLTAGLMDIFDDGLDINTELAIVKVFSSEKVAEHISRLLQVFGGDSILQGRCFEKVIKDSRIFDQCDGTNDITKLYIGLSGLEFAGKEIFDLVDKLRNPLLHPYFTLRQCYERIRPPRDQSKLNVALNKCAHLALSSSADELEHGTKLLRIGTESFLGRKGKNVVLPSNQLNVKRMAEIAIDLYAMTAVIGRASRSCYMELDNRDEETSMANLFCLDAIQRIKNNAIHVNDYSDQQSLIFKKLTDSLFEKRAFPIEHVLTRTFW